MESHLATSQEESEAPPTIANRAHGSPGGSLATVDVGQAVQVGARPRAPLVPSRITDRTSECRRPVTVFRGRLDRSSGELLSKEPVQLPCGTKGCEHCSEVRRRRLVAHGSRIFSEAGPGTLFFTLTIDPRVGLEVNETAAYVKYCWTKLRKRLARRGDLTYMCAVEHHKSGRAHLHGLLHLAGPALTLDEVRGMVFECGFGAVSDFSTVTSSTPEGMARAVGYCVKYASKDDSECEGRGLMWSQGHGLHSAEQIERRERMTGAVPQAEPEGIETVWHVPPGGGSRGSDMGLTPERLARFEALDLSTRLQTYRHRDSAGGWWRHTYDRFSGELTKKRCVDPYEARAKS